MHSVSNLIKFNAIKDKKIEYEKLGLQELRNYQKKYKDLQENKKLISTLKDKGEKIRETLLRIENLIENREKTVVNEPKEEKPTSSKIEVDTLLDKLEGLFVDKSQTPEALPEIKAEKVEENYFSKLSTSSRNETKKGKKQIDENKLNEIKRKISSNTENRFKYKESKMIPVDECFKLLKDHEKKIQEIQMKQAAERLLQGQSVRYDFSFIEKTEKQNLMYRETVTKEVHLTEEDDYYLNEEEYEEEDNEYFYQQEDAYTETGIDRVHKTETDRLKYKFGGELDKVD